jgi:hypothetical protein
MCVNFLYIGYSHLSRLIARENFITLSRQKSKTSHFINLYGEEIYHDTRHLEKLRKKKSKIKVAQLVGIHAQMS